MSDLLERTLVSPGALDRVFRDLKKLMGQIGLIVSVWDVNARRLDDDDSIPCEFSRMLDESGELLGESARKLAECVIKNKTPRTGRAETGHCLLAVPVYRRRRILAAVTGCFPVREMLDEEFLARLCDRLELDYEAVKTVGERTVRHAAPQAQDFLKILTCTLETLQANAVAQDELRTFSANLASTYEELSLLYRISGSMHVTQQPEQFLQNICNELLDVMNISGAVAVVYSHPPTLEEDMIVTAGNLGVFEEQIKSMIVLEVAPAVAAAGRSLVRNNFAASREYGGKEAVRNLIAVPVVSEGETIGILVGLNKTESDFDSIDLKLVSAISDQAGVFLANSRLYADLQDLLMGVLHALTATIDAKDPYTSGHSQRVALISRRLAQECGFEPEKVQQIYLAGLLHDIGKIGVPEGILRKEGRLTAQEYEDMKRHPTLGASILGGIRQLDEVIVGILNHHERPDGKGYPRGLSGEKIPIEGKIICIGDCFDAMTSFRTYREALPLDLAIEEIHANAGTQFDAELVEKFVSIDLEKFMEEIHQPARTVFPFVPRQQESKA